MVKRGKKTRKLLPEQEEMLISLVQGKPFLYNMRSAEYRDKDMKINGWNDIASNFESFSVDEVKATWAALKKQYTDFKRKSNFPSGSGAAANPFFRHSDGMSFYDEFYKPYKNITQEEENASVDGNDSNDDAQCNQDSQLNMMDDLGLSTTIFDEKEVDELNKSYGSAAQLLSVGEVYAPKRERFCFRYVGIHV